MSLFHELMKKAETIVDGKELSVPDLFNCATHPTALTTTNPWSSPIKVAGHLNLKLDEYHDYKNATDNHYRTSRKNFTGSENSN